MLEEYLGKDPRSRGHYLLGQAYAQMGNHEKARDNYEAAIRIYPEYREAYNGLAMAYERLGETDKAKQAMDKFRQPNWTPGLKLRAGPGIRIDRSRSPTSATPPFSTPTQAGSSTSVRRRETRNSSGCGLRRWTSKNVPCRQSLAWFCRNAGRQGENIVWLKQLADLEPANASYWMEIGRIYEDLLLLPAAEESFRKACQAAPESDTGYAALADLLLRYEQNLPETVDLARKAIQLRPSAPNYAMLSAACRANQDLAGAGPRSIRPSSWPRSTSPIEPSAMPSRRIRNSKGRRPNSP